MSGSVYGPAGPMSKMFFNMLAVFAEFEAGLLKMVHPRGHGDRPLPQPTLGPGTQAGRAAADPTGANAWHRDYTIAELMQVFSVARATVCRVLERAAVSPTARVERPLDQAPEIPNY
ncbi:hypothetical protein [Nonomuraea sp. NPDC052265]|uniref:hypothetical protein n=1 Tax=Nonomuraea sp. NPDC052265 TaxID=3364374 RepID=UPI0037C50AC7